MVKTSFKKQKSTKYHSSTFTGTIEILDYRN